jgi:hypothetical protein
VMSPSGPVDANAEGSLIEDIWRAAYDLRQAIKRAKASEAQIIREINNGLRSSGFRIVPDDRIGV